jgi:glutamate receptor, ionotropic, invertebrate
MSREERSVNRRFGILFQTDAALIYDAVYVFAHALEQVEPSYSRMRLVNLSCDGEQAWAFGSSLYSYLNLVGAH